MTNLDFAAHSHGALGMGVCALLLSSCNIANGIADFGNHVVNQPPVAIGDSHRIATGQYSSPIVDPWDDAGPVIIAFEYLDGSPHLAMRPVSGSKGCDTDLAYSSIVRDKLDNRTQLVAYEGAGDAQGRGPVHFIDHSCQQYGATLPKAKLPAQLYRDPPGYLIEAADSTETMTQLLIVDPWNNSSTVLAGNVTWWGSWPSSDLALAVIDNGHFKIFDDKHQVTSDLGASVTTVVQLPSPAGSFLLLDGGTLRKYQSVTDPAPVEIAKDACQPVPDGGGCLFYFSPCDTRQLQCFRSDTGTSIAVDSGIGGPIASRVTAGDPNITVIYTKSSAQGGGSDLWSFSSGTAPAPIVPNFSRMYGWSPPPNLEIDALVNADSNVGQAIRHTAAGDTDLADSVSVNFSQGLLANFDVSRSNGDLFTPIQLGQVPEFVIGGVPWFDKQNSIFTSKNTDSIPYGTAVITDATGDVGNLTLLRYPSAVSPGPDLPRTIASNVPVNGCKFFEGMNAIAYTENWSDAAKTGTFVVHELDLDARTVVSDEVKEFQEVKWPSEGVMYIIFSGDRAGIWLAKAK